MVQIIQENRRPGFAENFAQVLSGGMKGLNNYFESQEAKDSLNKENDSLDKENDFLSKMGFDVSGVKDKDLRKQLLQAGLAQQKQEQKFGQDVDLQKQKYDFENQAKAEKLRGENKEKLAPLQGAKDTLKRMKSLRKKGNLGIGASYSPYSSTRKDAGEYEQLGKSLIQHATNIPIRNRVEFETLAEKLYDPNITDAAAEGILDAMDTILNNSLKAHEGESLEGESPKSMGSPQKPKRSLTSFAGKQ